MSQIRSPAISDISKIQFKPNRETKLPAGLEGSKGDG